MDRQEAIEILTEYNKVLKGEPPYDNSKNEFIVKFSDLTQAIDTLIAPIPVTDEMVERGAKSLAGSYWENQYPLKASAGLKGMSKKQYVEKSWQSFIPEAKAALTAALGGNNAIK